MADAKHPMFFLAGPIRGGGDWQQRMCVALQSQHQKQFIVACPCRWDTQHPLNEFFLKRDVGCFKRQLDWERCYLHLAGLKSGRGCIIFWLGCESKEHPHPGPEPYAMDTRGELGEWRWRMRMENARVVIGAESGFLGLSQIQRNFSQALGYDFPIHKTIEETAKAAVNFSVKDE